MNLGIGICARNEEAGILACLQSVIRAAEAARLEKWELVICLNGCTDRTSAIVSEWCERNRQYNVHIEVLPVANLVAAQRIVAKRLSEVGAHLLMFFDADIVVDANCVRGLVEAVSPIHIRAAYACSVPLVGSTQTLIERALNLYDTSPTIFTERRHIHGRAFVIRKWNIPETDPPLLADDIYLSCDLLYAHGPAAIARAKDAIVQFHQVSTVADFYRAQKRRSIEMEKCLRLFPQFRALPRDQINRQVVWSRFLKEPLARSFLWFYLLGLRRYCKLRLVVEKLLFRKDVEWEITHTSKRPINGAPEE